ncbi:MAG: DUF4389 domain-containing protein [Chloroflexota bacterium]
MTTQPFQYPARLSIDYPQARLDRLTTFFRLIWVIPVAILSSLLTGIGWLATAIMIAARQRYPRWWFDYSRELTKFTTRVGAYVALLTDQYPSTEDEQSVHLELDYPDAMRDLNRWMPLVKWVLAIQHYIALFFLGIGVFFAVLIAWFAILFTGSYRRALFDYVVGVTRWGLRVNAYAFLLVTDRYPPFSLS